MKTRRSFFALLAGIFVLPLTKLMRHATNDIREPGMRYAEVLDVQLNKFGMPIANIENKKFEEVHAGDVFRLRNSDDSLVDDGKWFQAQSEPARMGQSSNFMMACENIDFRSQVNQAATTLARGIARKAVA